MATRQPDPAPYARGGLITTPSDPDLLTRIAAMPGGPIIPAHVARRVGANLLKQLNDATSYQRYSQTRDHVWDGD